MASSRTPRRGSHPVLYAGLFLAFSLGLFVGLYFLYGKLGRTWQGVAEIRVLFAQARALKAGAPVFYNGMEVGRVKDVRVVHLNKSLIGAMPVLGKKDLHNLPITEEVREKIDRMRDEDADAELKNAIPGRIMVLAKFDMLIEHDEKRLHADDSYIVATSKIGDSAIQIITGNGKLIVPNETDVFLGVNSDLISDIGKNMAQIEEILHSMADIMGGDAKKAAVQDQFRNFEGFTANLEKQTEAMLVRLPDIWNSIDLRAEQSEKNMVDITEKILGIFPKVDAALGKTLESIESMHASLDKSAQVAVDELKRYRGLARTEVARWRKLSAEYREKTPERLKEIRKMSETALAAVGKLDEALTRVDQELNHGSESARAAIGAQTDAAMQVQEAMWNFKKTPAYFTSKYTPAQLAQRHLAWRFEMARVQYAELRRELAALQGGLSTADPADRERAKAIEERLAESDAFFNLNRGDFVPGQAPLPQPAPEKP